MLVASACGGGEAPRPQVEALEGRRFEVGGAPWGVALDEAGVWVSDAGRGVALRLDDDGTVVQELPTGADDPRDVGLVVADGRLWIANLGGTVGILDPTTGGNVRVEIGPGEPAAVVAGAGDAMWVPLHGPGGGLAHLRRSTPGDAARRTSLPESAFAVAVSADLVWVAGLEGRLFAVDAETGGVERTIDLGGAPRGVAVEDGDVWVSLRDAGTVVRVDGRTGEVTARIAVGGQPWPIAAGGGGVWVATLEGRLLRIDPERDQVVASAPVGAGARSIAVGTGVVWVASQSGIVTRVESGG